MTPNAPEPGRFTATDLACLRGERLLFRGLGFALEPGDALVLIGGNGSGKSSLLRLLAGLLVPAAGLLSWNGQPVAQDPEAHRARLQYLGHADAIKPALTVRETLRLHARLRGHPVTAADASGALEQLAIGHLLDAPGRFLSAGQRRRVALARLLLSPARLWLLDEPTVGLDRDALAAFSRICAAHRAAGGAVVAATHGELGIGPVQTLSPGDFAPSYEELAGADHAPGDRAVAS